MLLSNQVFRSRNSKDARWTKIVRSRKHGSKQSSTYLLGAFHFSKRLTDIKASKKQQRYRGSRKNRGNYETIFAAINRTYRNQNPGILEDPIRLLVEINARAAINFNQKIIRSASPHPVSGIGRRWFSFPYIIRIPWCDVFYGEHKKKSAPRK